MNDAVGALILMVPVIWYFAERKVRHRWRWPVLLGLAAFWIWMCGLGASSPQAAPFAAVGALIVVIVAMGIYFGARSGWRRLHHG